MTNTEIETAFYSILAMSTIVGLILVIVDIMFHKSDGQY